MEIENSKPLVSICCLVYNHEDYLREALDSFLMQQTNFAFEVIIHDDASTDSSPDIIKEYASKYPKIFNPLYQTENQKSKVKSGMNPRFNYPRARGKYIALCEGDDYWIDPLKLQKQVDFLEANDRFVISCHNSNVVDLNNSFVKIFNDKEIPEITDTSYILEETWYIPTASVVFRKSNLIFPNWFSKALNGDYMTYLILTNDGGLVHYDKNIMSSYRKHIKGVSNIFNDSYVFNNSMLTINKNFNKFSNYRYKEICLKNIDKYSIKILEVNKVFSKKSIKVILDFFFYDKQIRKSLLRHLRKRFVKKIRI